MSDVDAVKGRALILTYHAVEPGPAPLCLPPALFERHLDCIAAAGAQTLTIAQLADALRRGSVPDRTVAITFDDAFASAATVAAPLLIERGFTATFFCVGDYVGKKNDWPTQPASAPRLPLAAAEALRELVSAGFEIGAHGLTHAPLAEATADELERELVLAKERLSDVVDSAVTSLAFPYGAAPGARGRAAVAASYSAACTTQLRFVAPRDDPLSLPRVDAHFVRHPRLFRMALAGSAGGYLVTRRWATRARHSLVRDYVRGSV